MSWYIDEDAQPPHCAVGYRVRPRYAVRVSPTQELAWRAYDRVLERIRNQDGEPVSSADLIALVRAIAREGTYHSHGSAWNLVSRWLRTHPRVERTEKFMRGAGEGFGWRWRT